MKPRKIACFIHSLSGGGAERVMAGLTNDLALRGHDVALVTLTPDSDRNHKTIAQVQRHCLDVDSNACSLFAKIRQVRKRHRSIADAIDRIKPDVVISFCDRTNIDVLLASHPDGPPVIACERSDPSAQSLGRFWERMRRKSYAKARCVVALTEASAGYLEAFAPRVVVIPSAVRAPDLVSDRKTAQANRCIVGAGRLENEKGFDRLIRAFAVATKTHPDWTLKIYGDGRLRDELREFAATLGIIDRVEMPGWVQPLTPELAQASIFCLSSRYEGFPSVLLEAMSVGVPSISVDCESGPRAIINHEQNGLLVPDQSEALAAGLQRMIADDETRERFGHEGRNVTQRYGWDAMIDSYENLVAEVAAR
ncbi:glycosyltransferase family 4 protein [Rhodopirellula sp. MGV]|uniref:glycosyltransferase family 4 protein n=1 Tax=Rhodopirellula sp. MGV TaxID=2023130 RepID=UPI0013044238|nr:glycosyltransferase family 4 protein [Rhodopirellula sp. MGV]